MEKPEIRPEQLRGLETKFCAFLRDVSLRSETGSRHRGLDGLHHFTLLFQGDTVQLEEPGRYGYFYRPGSSKPLSLQWDDEALGSVVAETQKLCPGVSEKQIKKTLRDLMLKIFHKQAVREDADTVGEDTDAEVNGELETILDILDTSNIGQELLETIRWLRSLAVPQIVYVPIEGLKLSSSLTIEEVELHPRNERSALDQTLGAVEESQGEVSASYIHKALRHVNCYATVKSVGNDGFVISEAIQRVKKALHILNLCLSSSLYQPSWAKIQIAGVIINETLPTEDSEGGRIGLYETSSSNRPFELSRSKLVDVIRPIYARSFSAQASHPHDWVKEQNMIKQSVDRLLTCFQASDDIARRIQRAVTWYSKAVDADTPEEKSVNLAIALESLLIGDEGKGPYATTGSIKQNLGERVAFLLEDDFESRQRRFRETKELYHLRSAIVHRGKQMTKEDLARMDKLVKQVTLTFLTYEFKSWTAFQEWIARQKYEKKRPPQE